MTIYQKTSITADKVDRALQMLTFNFKIKQGTAFCDYRDKGCQSGTQNQLVQEKWNKIVSCMRSLICRVSLLNLKLACWLSSEDEFHDLQRDSTGEKITASKAANTWELFFLGHEGLRINKKMFTLPAIVWVLHIYKFIVESIVYNNDYLQQSLNCKI